MKKRAAAWLVFLFVSCGAARADMIEVKGRGILNGKIVSQDENGVQFRDSTGSLLSVPKADVLFLEAQKDTPPPSRGSSEGFQRAMSRWSSRAGRWISDVRYEIRKFTEKTYGAASKPLDRSLADAKAKKAADALAEATDALRKTRARQKNEAKNQRTAKEFYAKDASGRAAEEVVRGAEYRVRDDAKFSLD